MKTTLTTICFLAVLVLAAAKPRLNRRQATETAPAAATDDAAAPAEAPSPSPPADVPAPAPVAPAPAETPEARAAPPRTSPVRPPPPPPQPQPQPSGPSVFVLPDGAGLIVGEIREGFTCEGKIYGYYADVSNDCKIFHVCVPVLDEEGKASQPALIFSFFCNNGTIFNQANLVCDYQDNVDCSQSEAHYSINQEFGRIPEGSQAAQGRSAPAPPAAPAPAPVPAASPSPATEAAPPQPAPPQPAAAAAPTRT